MCDALSQVYTPVRAQRGDDWLMEHLVPMGGNLMEAGLGLRQTDRETLCLY